MTGLSTSQMTCLIRAYRDTGSVREKPYRRHEFPVRYRDVDVTLLAELDRAHERLSGPAPRSILQASLREIRRAGISAAQQGALPQTGCRVRADATGGGVDRGTAQAGPARPAQFPAGGHGCIRAIGTAPRGCSTAARSTQ